MKINREDIFGDRRRIDGFFEWFRNSYELRDSTMYGRLLAPEFKFTYLNFENSTEESWDRNVEMQSTYNLFRGTKSITLQWNNFIELDTISFDTLARAERSFNLVIYWRMQSWYDKSDF
ncbi:MAG: hypothetical protein EOP49_26560 [Sphingobacteriales bacterium]|nr:MAG: hypothetical protein EOP49_26560 [Sphingobacteriales bacterium]